MEKRFNTAIWFRTKPSSNPSSTTPSPSSACRAPGAGLLELDRRGDARLRWAAFARAATPGTNLSTDHAAATAMLLWLRLFGFLKNINRSLATFVVMFDRIVRDLRVFMVFFLMIILAFGSAFYFYLGQHEAEYYGFHDDGAPNEFESVRMTIFSLLLLGFIGDYDLDNYPNPADRTYLVYSWWCRHRAIEHLDRDCIR